MGKPAFPMSQPLLGAAGTPTGRDMGKPGCPISRLLLGAAGAPTGRGAVRQAHRRWGNPVAPSPNRCWERLAPPRAGIWGNPLSPCPNRCWERLAPPRAGKWGNLVSPFPNRCWERLVPHRQEDGETRFPRIFTSAKLEGGRGVRTSSASGRLRPETLHLKARSLPAGWGIW